MKKKPYDRSRILKLLRETSEPVREIGTWPTPESAQVPAQQNVPQSISQESMHQTISQGLPALEGTGAWKHLLLYLAGQIDKGQSIDSQIFQQAVQLFVR